MMLNIVFYVSFTGYFLQRRAFLKSPKILIQGFSYLTVFFLKSKEKIF